MPHDTALMSTIVMGLVLAFLFGAAANRLRLPPVIGYLLAGIVVGPHTAGIAGDAALAAQLGDIALILLMFGVGLRFSLKDMLGLPPLALPGALVQIAGTTLLGLGLALLMGWSIGAGVLFGLALSVASPVVLLGALRERRLLGSDRGRLATGWLTAGTAAMVLALVLVPALAAPLGGAATGIHDPFVSFVERLVGGSVGLWGVLALTLLKLAAFVGFMLIVGRRIVPAVLYWVADSGHRELSRLAILAVALGIAGGAAYLFGVSLALGAFFAGMILSENELSHRTATAILPLRDAFAVPFFLSVGMLFDPGLLLSHPLALLATLLIILFAKPALAYLMVIVFRRPVDTALTVSASLAQIGEFSLILAALGVGLGMVPAEAQGLIIAGALLSILLNPLVFRGVELLRPRIEARRGDAEGAITPRARLEPGLDAVSAAPSDTDNPAAREGHVVVVGYGRVGKTVAERLRSLGQHVVLIEDAERRATEAKEAGFDVVHENGALPAALAMADIARARALLVTIADGFESGRIVAQGRRLNPGLRIIACAASTEESDLRRRGADDVLTGDHELGLGMVARLDLVPQPADDPQAPPRRLPPAPTVVAVPAEPDQLAAQPPAPEPTGAAEEAELASFAQSDLSPEYFESEALRLENADHLEPQDLGESDQEVLPPASGFGDAIRDETASRQAVIVIDAEPNRPVESAAPPLQEAGPPHTKSGEAVPESPETPASAAAPSPPDRERDGI